MKRVLVTGASGFVGTALCAALKRRGYLVRSALRTARAPIDGCEEIVVGNIDSATDWSSALDRVDFVFHIAARAHNVGDSAENAALYTQTNAQGTLRLATSAAAARVHRLIYLSSAKVNGEENDGRPFTAADTPHPQDDYSRSKWLGEMHVQEVARSSGMEAVIIRPPLVYGPGVRANFLQLMRWVERGWPLPFEGIRNARSFVSIWNLTDLLVHTVEHPDAAGRTWMVSDGHDLSTSELIRHIGRALRRPVKLVRVPPWLLQAAAAAIGRADQMSRLTGSLTVDIVSTCRSLDWMPPLDVEQSLERTAAWYLMKDKP
jgi:nucleoside-diphosphate-sugar epimerase